MNDAPPEATLKSIAAALERARDARARSLEEAFVHAAEADRLAVESARPELRVATLGVVVALLQETDQLAPLAECARMLASAASRAGARERQAEALAISGMARRALGQHGEAIRALRGALELGLPATPGLRAELALARVSAGDVGRDLESELLALLALVEATAGAAGAVDTSGTSGAADTSGVGAAVRAALVEHLLALGAVVRAAEHAEALPRTTRPQIFLRARAALEAGHFARALGELDAALVADAPWPEGLLARGAALEGLGRDGEALDALSALASSSSAAASLVAEARVRRAAIAARLGQSEAARDDLAHVLGSEAAARSHPSALVVLAGLELGLDRPEEAQRRFAEALALTRRDGARDAGFEVKLLSAMAGVDQGLVPEGPIVDRRLAVLATLFVARGVAATGDRAQARRLVASAQVADRAAGTGMSELIARMALALAPEVSA